MTVLESEIIVTEYFFSAFDALINQIFLSSLGRLYLPNKTATLEQNTTFPQSYKHS